MGLFEKIAVTDLKFRTILVPFGLLCAWGMVLGHWWLGPPNGITYGAVVGAVLGVLAAYGTWKLLPS